MKLEIYQANLVIVNQNTDPKRHGVCGNDGLISFNPPQLRDQFMAEHAALVAVAERVVIHLKAKGQDGSGLAEAIYDLNFVRRKQSPSPV
jgi:hypothetical protein